MLEVQKYLQSGKSLQDLEAEFAIRGRRHCQYPQLVLFKYSQIDSPKGSKLVQQCRGLILDESNNWAVVSRSLDRFFNAGEHYASELDTETVKAYEKLDGSLMCLYWYDKAWHVQTSGTPDASGQVGNTDYTFKSLFWQTWQDMGLVLPSTDRLYLTYIFELTGPSNQVVVKYDKHSIRLLAVRERNGQELDSEAIAQLYGWPHAKRFNACDLNMTLPPSELEGYVLVDKYCNRVKVKTAAYVAMHRSSNGMSPADALSIVMAGELDEVLAYWPKYADLLTDLQAKWLKLNDLVAESWAKYSHLAANRSEFAKAVSHLSYKHVLFSIADGKDWVELSKAKPERLLKVLVTIEVA